MGGIHCKIYLWLEKGDQSWIDVSYVVGAIDMVYGVVGGKRVVEA